MKDETEGHRVSQKETWIHLPVVKELYSFLRFHLGPARRRTTAMVLIILVLGFLLRLYFALTVHLNLDEGSYLYDAQLLRDGKVPFRDY